MGRPGKPPRSSIGADFIWCWANRFEFVIITIAVLRY